jgi:calcium-dependent protein kinase
MELGKFSEEFAAESMRQIIKAVNYCHKNHLCHRDLKPENLLYETNKPNSLLKLIEFGVSTNFEPNVKLT